MEGIIVRSRIALGHSSLDDRALTATALAFLELLDRVPDDTLNECFRVAMKEKTDNYPLSVIDLCNAFELICEERVMEQRRRQDEYLALPQPEQKRYTFAEWRAMRAARDGKLDVKVLERELRAGAEEDPC